MPEYPPVPQQPPFQDTGLLAAWYAAAVHEEEIDWIMGRITVSPYLELEPPRRPPSWYPGQPEPPRPRKRPCKCAYVRRFVPDAPGPYSPVTYPDGTTRWFTWCFVIVFDCPHHGDDRYDLSTVGGVWGFDPQYWDDRVD